MSSSEFLHILEGSCYPKGLYQLFDGVLYQSVDIGSDYYHKICDFNLRLVSVEIISSVDELRKYNSISRTLISGVAGMGVLGPLGAVGGMLAAGSRQEHVKYTIIMGALDSGDIFLAQGSMKEFTVLKAIASKQPYKAAGHRLRKVSDDRDIDKKPIHLKKILWNSKMRAYRDNRLSKDKTLCPKCGEVILAAARRCKYCKSEI